MDFPHVGSRALEKKRRDVTVNGPSVSELLIDQTRQRPGQEDAALARWLRTHSHVVFFSALTLWVERFLWVCCSPTKNWDVFLCCM